MDPADLVTYEEFGRRFFEVAVTEQRVGDAIGAIAGEAFEMGPIAQGPGRLAKVTAKKVAFIIWPHVDQAGAPAATS